MVDMTKVMLAVACLTYLAFTTAVCIVIVMHMYEWIDYQVNRILTKSRIKKLEKMKEKERKEYEEFIESLPEGDIRRSMYNFGKALSKLGSIQGTEVKRGIESAEKSIDNAEVKNEPNIRRLEFDMPEDEPLHKYAVDYPNEKGIKWKSHNDILRHKKVLTFEIDEESDDAEVDAEKIKKDYIKEHMQETIESIDC